MEGQLSLLCLNVGRDRALGTLRRFGPCTMSELATFSVVDRTTLTCTLDQLVKAGFAELIASIRLWIRHFVHTT